MIGRVVPVLLLPLLTVLPTDSGLGATDPWQVLEDLRQGLAAEPLQATFVQTYLPAGFTSGDQETGRLYLALPDCVRWDYEEPSPKHFLLCRDTVFTWNPGEAAGRRYRLSEGNEPGVDLLRLRVEDLRLRYAASLASGPEGRPEIVLTPVDPTSPIAEARLVPDRQGRRLAVLMYRDLEGNTSRFEISDYQPDPDNAPFDPPEDVEWLEE